MPHHKPCIGNISNRAPLYGQTRERFSNHSMRTIRVNGLRL